MLFCASLLYVWLVLGRLGFVVLQAHSLKRQSEEQKKESDGLHDHKNGFDPNKFATCAIPYCLAALHTRSVQLPLAQCLKQTCVILLAEGERERER